MPLPRQEPVFASVYSSSAPQYVMCFNQVNRSVVAVTTRGVFQLTSRLRRQWSDLCVKTIAIVSLNCVF